MPTKYMNFTGTTKYVNGMYGGLFEPDPKFGNFQIRLYPDPASWDKFKKSGLRLEPKTDEDGDYIQFRRAEQKLMKKELVNFGRPKVFFKDGVEPTRNIGNGSTIEVNVAVYDTREGKGHRLESVKVLDLIEYNREGSGPGGFVEYTENSEPQGKVESDTSKKTGVSDKERSDEKDETPPWEDEVPFGEEKEEVESRGSVKERSDEEAPKKSASPFRKSR